MSWLRKRVSQLRRFVQRIDIRLIYYFSAIFVSNFFYFLIWWDISNFWQQLWLACILICNVFVQINQDLSRVKRFNAQEALEYGLIDRIVRPPRIKADAPRKDAGTGLG